MEEKDWFKYRGYPHISNDIPASKKEEIRRYVANPKKVATHSFLPLISKQIIQRRFKRFDSFNSNVRSHRVIKNGIPQSSKKIRTIMYSCHKDAHLYAYYTKEILQPKFESVLKENHKIDEAVIAYRKIPLNDKKGSKNNIHFAKEVFDEIKQRGSCAAVLFDIENFFPSLDHKQLKLAWAKILGCKTLPKNHYNLFKSVTNYSFINLHNLKSQKGHFDEKKLAEIRSNGKHSYFNTVKEFLESDIQAYKNPTKGKGIPQGLPISALLANIYMNSFDNSIVKELCEKFNVFYRRYSDDMIFVCDVNIISQVKEYVLGLIKDSKLIIAPDKTEVVSFNYNLSNEHSRLESCLLVDGKERQGVPLSYLGFEFYGYQTLIKSKNLSAFYRQMKETIARKDKRTESLRKTRLTDDEPLFKRKVYRLYSYKGIKARKLLSTSCNRVRRKDYRGNFVKYALKASEVMEAPEIKKQLRNHWSILQATIDKYEFSNNQRKISKKR